MLNIFPPSSTRLRVFLLLLCNLQHNIHVLSASSVLQCLCVVNIEIDISTHLHPAQPESVVMHDNAV